MKRLARVISALVSLAAAASAESSRPSPKVSLAEPTPDDRVAADRLAAELRSEGYVVEGAVEAQSPCESTAGGAQPPEEHVWIRIDSSGGFAANLLTIICYRSANGHLSSAVAGAPSGDAALLSLSTVEALNGLRSDPVSGSPMPNAADEPEPQPPSLSSFSVGASFAFASPELAPLLGPRLELQSAGEGYLSLAYDGFVTLRPTEIERSDRRIELSAAWMRLGPRLSAPLSVLRFDVSLLGGPGLVWTTADADAPLLGSADSAAVAVVSLGGGVEVPRRSSFFLRAAARGSVLVPRVTIETGDGVIPTWLFVETSLGLGLRWSDGR